MGAKKKHTLKRRMLFAKVPGDLIASIEMHAFNHHNAFLGTRSSNDALWLKEDRSPKQTRQLGRVPCKRTSQRRQESPDPPLIG